MTIERSRDYELIRGIITEPSIYRHLSDDCSPPADEYRPIESDAVWYLVVRDEDEVLGLWMLHAQNSICWEVHTAVLPDAWGDRAHEAALLMLDWVWRNTPCRRLVTNVPIYNRLAYRFARAAGMHAYGRNKASFLKDGQLIDQICLGICRPDDMLLFEELKEEKLWVFNE